MLLIGIGNRLTEAKQPAAIEHPAEYQQRTIDDALCDVAADCCVQQRRRRTFRRAEPHAGTNREGQRHDQAKQHFAEPFSWGEMLAKYFNCMT